MSETATTSNETYNETKPSTQQQQQQQKSLAEEYAHVAKALEQIETKLRIQHIPSLITRAPFVEVEDLKEDAQKQNNNNNNATTEVKKDNSREEGKGKKQVCATITDDGSTASLRRYNLRTFSLSLLTNSPFFSTLQNLTTLDVSKNELMDLPSLSSLPNLCTLNLERNWFNTLPLEIGSLTNLKTLIASRNFLRPNAASLLFPQLRKLTELKTLDLLYNQKCGRSHHRDVIQKELPQLKTLKLTLWEQVGNVPNSYIGASAAERNEYLLRSQLEPFKTVTLRQRLVQDFGKEPTDAAVVDRAGVMEQLLDCYREEKLMDEEGVARRHRVHVKGTPVDKILLEELMVELKSWTEETGKVFKNRERPSIRAKNYMILRAPKVDDDNHATPFSVPMSTRASRRAKRKNKKLEKYKLLWDKAMMALQSVDAVFAQRCTEIAVTYGFQGSPHIDKQNCGPFYGLALGNFKDGQGGICVECSARVVAVMNTKNCMGRVDGRYPHWVDAYDDEEEGTERYSLIYYETGNKFVKPGPAIFTIPKENVCNE